MRSLRVAIYARQSKTDAGRVPSTDWQQAECRTGAEKRGHTVVGTYTDVDLSGYREILRPEFERLLADLRSGAFDAVMAWSIDRLTRKGCWGRDTVELLRGIQEAGIVLFTLEEDYDTTTARGKRRLADDLSRAEEESEKISKRSKAGKEAAAARGGVKDGGPRPFGFTTVVDADGTKGVALVAGEVDMIRHAAGRVLDGGSLRATVLDWNRLGLKTSTGGKWSQQSLRNLLLQPRLVGDRVYRGEVIRRDAFPPVLDRQVFEGVGAILVDDARRSSRPVRSYVLTGIARCSACGSRMRSNQPAGGPRRYACPPKPEGCNGRTIVAEALEELVAEAVLQSLDPGGLDAALAESAEGAAEAIEAGAELREAEQRFEDLSRERARGEISRGEWAIMREELQAQIDAARSRMARGRRRSPLAQYQGRDVRALWGDLGVEEKRQIISTVVERVVISPATHGHRFDPERVEIEWRY